MNQDDLKMLRAALLGVSVLMGSAAPASAISVSPLHGSDIHVDFGAGLTSAYVGYSVTNDDGFDHSDLWVRLEDFVGSSIAPAAMEDGIYHLGRLDAGETKPAYFYLTVSGPAMGPETHAVAVYDGPPAGPPLVAMVFPLIIDEALGANANKIRQVVSFPDPPVLGGGLEMTIVGETGVVGSTGEYAVSPAASAAWPADAFELESVQINFMDPNPDCTALLFSTVDELVVPLTPGLEYCYECSFVFRIRDEVAGVTPITPVTYISSGAQLKHLDLDCLTSLDCDITPPSNFTTIEKTVNLPSLPGAGTVNYAVAVNNAAATSVTLDGLTDLLPVLPGAASYVPSTATFGGAPIGDPIQVVNELTFVGPFMVPASGSDTLRFDVNLPADPGVYVNTAIGAIGGVQVDATLGTDDDAPAEAAVTVGSSVPGLAGPWAVVLALMTLIAGGWILMGRRGAPSR